MIKILYIVSTLKRSGPTNVLYNLIDELDRSKFEPVILTLSPEETKFPSAKGSFVDINVDVHSLHLSRLEGILSGRRQIKRFVKSQGVHAIHLMGFRGDLLILPKDFKGVEIISTLNSNIFDDYSMLYGKRRGTLMAWLHIRSLRGKTPIACSQFVSDKLYERYKIRTRVIYNGIPKNLYKVSSTEDKRTAKKNLDLPAGKKVFVFIGSLIFRKDPVTAIKGFLNNTNLENSHLIVLGDGPLMQDCKDVCAEHVEKVTFFGNQPETLKFLSASDFYIATAYSEGLPTSVMEAMGCGLPVILSAIDPHKELVDKIDSWQYLFPVNQNTVLTDRINKIQADNYAILSSKCREVIDDHINSTKMAENYQLLYSR
ncbi:glycosyltransferase family 4 protein [Mucilaginibacter sp.]|uniref:glycosyltransferase family 4 protein n=1 Tax=Mucilaginibacter sp. TaxID=1882438 RepID=UPI0035BC2855